MKRTDNECIGVLRYDVNRMVNDLLWTSFDFSEVDTATLERWMQRCVLPEDRRKSGSSDERYRSHLAGRAALAHLFFVLGLDIKVRSHPTHGYLISSKGYVNVSHSGNFAAAVVGMEPLGIDVEQLSRDPGRVMHRVLGVGESTERGTSSLLTVDGVSVRRSLAYWCAKEAVSKATGLGITFGMHRLRVDIDRAPPFPVQIDAEPLLKIEDPAVVLKCDSNLLVAICSAKKKLTKLHYSKFSFTTLNGD